MAPQGEPPAGVPDGLPPERPLAGPLAAGLRLAAAGDGPGAVAMFRQAAVLAPADPRPHLNAGSLLLDLGLTGEALPHLEQAMALAPGEPRAQAMLGLAQVRLGRDGPGFAHLHAACLHAFPTGTEADPPTATEARVLTAANLALALMAKGDHAAARPWLRRATALDPGRVEPWYLLALACQRGWDLQGAKAAILQALALAPGNPRVLANLSSVQKDLGQSQAAVESAFRAVQAAPGDSGLWSNLIFLLDFDSRQTTASQQAVRRNWAARFAPGIPAGIAPGRHAGPPEPARRLTIGYVSPDFRQHSAARAFGPVILQRDRERFAAICYMTQPAADSQTAVYRQAADGWREAAGLSDAELDAQIRADGIDILVDCCGHSEGHRLQVFARKPAPVQVSAWGHPTGTGLAAIDWLLTDPVVVPPAEDSLFAERPYRLEMIALLRPQPAPAGAIPDPAPPPAETRGGISFGAFARAPKLTDDSLRLWAAVLDAVPGARLVLKDFGFNREDSRRAFLERAAALGLPETRLHLLPGTSVAEHLAAFAEVDIALDTTPSTGGVGTGDALWMGVPVVTLYGATPAGRVSASLLRQVGLQDCIAGDARGYVAAAVRLAADPARRRDLRTALRPRFAASRAGDPVAHTRMVEDAWRDIWRRHCAALAQIGPGAGGPAATA